MGYFNFKTLEGRTLSTMILHAPQSSTTVTSSNAIVRKSKGKYRSWRQTVHFDNGTLDIVFFNRDTADTTTITMGLKNNLWYTKDKHNNIDQKSTTIKNITEQHHR